MTELRETVLDTSPRSFVALGMATAALILGVVACVLGQRRASWTGLPGRLAVAAGSLALLASGFVIAAVQAWRSVVIHHLLPSTRRPEEYVNAHLVNLGIRVQFAGLVFIGALMLLALTMLSLGLALSWRTEMMRGHRSLALSRLRTVALLLPVWPAAAGLLVYGLRMNEGFMGVAGTDPAMKTAELLRAIDGAYPTIQTARIGLLLLVALGAIGTVVTWRRGAFRPVSSVRLAAGVFVFLAGLVALTVTRGQAADRRPLPILPHVADASYANKVPSVSPCLPPESAPALEFTNDIVRLNGSPVDPDDEFRDHLLVARINHPLLRAGRSMPYLIVEATRATPTDRIIPYLQKLTEDTTVLVASATSRPFLSKTLGTIARYEYCGRPFRLSYEPTATHLSRYRTWSDVAAAISRSAEVLEFTAW
jgi:hypothetical protein